MLVATLRCILANTAILLTGTSGDGLAQEEAPLLRHGPNENIRLGDFLEGIAILLSVLRQRPGEPDTRVMR